MCTEEVSRNTTTEWFDASIEGNSTSEFIHGLGFKSLYLSYWGQSFKFPVHLEYPASLAAFYKSETHKYRIRGSVTSD